MLNDILPYMAKLLEDEKTEVRYAATSAFVSLAHLVQPQDLSPHILTIVLRLAHEDDKEEMRMTASVLLNRLANCLGPDLCTQFVIPEVLSLAEDPVFRVRKATALNFENVCKIGSEYELFERLMPAFVRLSKDEMYRVRRSCADNLTTISRTLGKELREGVMIEIFLRLSQDPSKLVRQSVLLQTGKFISTLSSKAVNDYILGIFISLADSPTGDASIDSELKHECAYSFPGVLLTLGYERWEHLRDLYRELAKCRSIVVKRTLALSLHEVAKILQEGAEDGIRVVEAELAPLFEYMIQDVEAVQVGVLKNLALFLAHLSVPTLLNYLPVLQELVHSTNPFNWRLRELLAIQLSALIRLPPRSEIYNTLFSLAMSLLQDPVAAVRQHSLRGMVTIVQLLSDLEQDDPAAMCPMPIDDEQVHMIPVSDCLETVALAINSLAVFETCYHRMLWIQLCHELLANIPKDIFEKYFIEGIMRLTTDSVANVRIALSKVLSGWDPRRPPWTHTDSPWTWLLKRKDIKQCIIRLSMDVKDVYDNIAKLQPVFPDISFTTVSCQGTRTPPGGIEPVCIDMDEVQFVAKYFSWEAVKSHFDDIIYTNEESLAEHLASSEDVSLSPAPNKRNNVNPISIAMLFVRSIKEKINSRRSSFREEVMANKSNKDLLAQHLAAMVMAPPPDLDREIKEGENLVAKILSKEASHSYLPATIRADEVAPPIPQQGGGIDSR